MNENRELEKVVSDKARRVKIRGHQAIVPLKFDKDGEVVSETTPPAKLILKRLTLNDLRFLKVFREQNWDVSKSCEILSLSPEIASRLAKKLSCFRAEDAKVKALAEIPTPAWITAKHVENVYDGGTLPDSSQKSLAELAKIEGAYKPTTNVNLNVNAFVRPQLSPEQEQKAREFFDAMATDERVA